jgi:hypothetical protein
LAILILGSCAYPKAVEPVDPATADLAVYRAVLDSMFVPHSTSPIRQLVVQDSTMALTPYENLASLLHEFTGLPGVDTATLRDFEQRSRQRRSLSGLSHLALAIPVVLVDRQTLKELPQNDPDLFWNRFYQLYPGASGHIVLSAVGYNPTRDLALVTVDVGCGGLCGNGYIVVLRRAGGAWKIATIKGTWIS